jgi:hypothetical protein
MSEWVITDPKATMIYATVDAENEVEAATKTDAGQAEWFWQAEVSDTEPLAVHDAVSLADGRWREAAPGTALPHGDVGGDYQISDGLGRRFWLALPDGTWAMLGITWYLSDDTDGAVTNPEGLRLYRQEEYMIVADIHEPGCSEIWADYRYLTEGDFPLTEAGVLEAIADFDVAELSWNGEEFR